MNRCGLLTAKHEPVPLKSVEVEVEVKDHVATVASTLNYENKEDKPLEAVFVFPMPGDAAVCHFSAKIGQAEIVAEVKEKQKAREEYDDALSSGQQAFLLEESEQSPDIFSLSVGCLPPGESASIRLEYVTELSVQADAGLRFCLPAVLNPRYQPQESGGNGGGNIQVTSIPASMVPYSLSFCAKVVSPRPVCKIESSSTLDPLQYLNTEQTQAMIKLAAGHKFDRDVELLIYYKDAHQPTAVVEAGKPSAKPGTVMGDPAVMLSLYPEFPQAVMSKVTSCGEVVCLLDRSGSMDVAMNNSKDGQTRISSAKASLLLLLKSLPMGCYFNIYSFGSSYEHIFPKSVEYSQKTMEMALKKVGEMRANLGGTEILRPLQHIFSHPCIQNHPRQLFVFTDGEVGNTKQVIDLVKKNSHLHRCFSFGIGEGASSALVNGLAKEGGGHAQFITGTDKMQPKVMQSLRYALQPAVVDVSVTWDLPKDVSVSVFSPPITALFHGERSLIYAQLTGKISEAAEGCVTVKYSLASHPSQTQLKFSLNPTEDTGLTVHRLAARALIRSMEMEKRESKKQQDESVKKKVVELSVQSGVSSAFTAFVAVNKGNRDTIQGPLERRNVPAPASCTDSDMDYCGCIDSDIREYGCIDSDIREYGCTDSDMDYCGCIDSDIREYGCIDSDIREYASVTCTNEDYINLSRSKEQYSSSDSDMDDYTPYCNRDESGPISRGIPPQDMPSLDSRESSVPVISTSLDCDRDESGPISRGIPPQDMPSLDSWESSVPVISTSLDCDRDESGPISRGIPPQDMPSLDSRESSVPVISKASKRKEKSGGIFGFLRQAKSAQEASKRKEKSGGIFGFFMRRAKSVQASKGKGKSDGGFVVLKGQAKSVQDECIPSEPHMDPFLQLVSLQKASGCWDLAPALATALGKTSQELKKMKPASADQDVWATVLSLIWLHGFKKDVQEEWELLAMKAVSWLGQNASCVEECMTAGNALLGCEVQKDALGL